MKKIFLLSFIFLLLVFLTSCNITENQQDEDDTDKGLYYEKYDDLFSLNNKVTITFNCSEEELKKVNDDYENYSSLGQKSEIYRYLESVTFKINDKEFVVPHVGIRMKGNTSLRSFVDENARMYNLVHFRLSFKQTFDDDEDDITGNPIYSNPLEWTKEERDAQKNRKVFGLEAIEMRYNKENDQTYVRELYTANLFRENNIYAQKMGVAQIRVNANSEGSLGVYRIAEVVDEVFINRYFPKDLQGGDLYKCGWGAGGGANFSLPSENAIGIETSSYQPTYDLKTNKKTSNYETLLDFLNFLDEDQLQINKTYSFYLDTEYFVTIQALYFMIGDPDSLRYNDNNFYMYFTKEGLMYIIPYDYDRTFGAKYTWNPLNASLDVGPLQFINCNGSNTNNVLINKTINNSYIFRDLYIDKINEILNSDYFSFTEFTKLYNIAYESYNDMIYVDYQDVHFDVSFSLEESNNSTDTNYNYSVELYFENKRFS